MTSKNYLRGLSAVLLVCVAMAGVIVAWHHGHPGRPDPLKGPYVAMGDSYTAGPKIPKQTGSPAGCGRSDHNYPTLVARSLGITGTDFHDVSCSGATIIDLTAPQHTQDGVNPAQSLALSTTTRLVTIGIGGNDIDFATLVTRCVTSGLLYFAAGSGKYIPTDTPCRDQYVHDGTDVVEQKIHSTGQRLSDALSEIKRRAPHAHIYVVGYPAVVPAANTDCGRSMALAPGDVAYLREKEQHLNAVLRERAAAAGADYVDTYTPSIGYDACSNENTRWIEPLLPSTSAAAVHPNERGECGMADAVLHALNIRT